jgi:hypothetical protein
MKKKPATLLGLLMIVALITLACVPGQSASTSELPGGPVVVSEEAALRLEKKVSEAMQQGPSSQVNLTITDEELTSWLALRAATEPGTMIADPQVRFTKGKLFAAVTLVGVLPFRLRVNLESSMQIVDDRVQFEIRKSSAGPIPVPGFVLDALSKTVNETLLETQLDVQVDSVDILESEVTLTGRIRTT